MEGLLFLGGAFLLETLSKNGLAGEGRGSGFPAERVAQRGQAHQDVPFAWQHETGAEITGVNLASQEFSHSRSDTQERSLIQTNETPRHMAQLHRQQENTETRYYLQNTHHELDQRHIH